MEDILDLYEEPYDPKRPVIGVDERPCQLIGDIVMPIPMKPGKRIMSMSGTVHVVCL